MKDTEDWQDFTRGAVAVLSFLLMGFKALDWMTEDEEEDEE